MRPTPAAPAPTTTAAVASPAPAPRVSNEDWRHDYDYVFKDLRKLAVVTAILFAIIIALGFFI